MSDFVICINNARNPASLIVGKVYRTLPETETTAHNMLRIIDEDKSEPDGYLYPASTIFYDRQQTHRFVQRVHNDPQGIGSILDNF